MLKEITEEEAYSLAGDAEVFPILFKEENEETESAVCLKRFPTGYILGVSCDRDDIFRLFFCEEYDELLRLYKHYEEIMKANGTPFSESAR